jgi:hypothetical protein
MTIADPKSGGWTLKERLLYTSMNLIRTGLLSAIDGVGGGSYSPSAVIDIAGSNGLRIGGTGSAAYLRYTSRDVDRVMPDSCIRPATANWTFDYDPAFLRWSTTTASNSIHCELTGLPHGSTLKTITVRWLGVTSGSLPGVMPTIRAYKVDAATNTPAALFAAVSDPSASNAAYTVAHDIPKTSIAEVIDSKTYRYKLIMTSGSGGGWTGDRLYGVTVTCTVTEQSEWEG